MRDRILTDQDRVFEHNAWDSAEITQEYLSVAQDTIHTQQLNPVPEHLQQQYNSQPHVYWDIFYKSNKDKFFKDRKWLRDEFPEIFSASKVLELGCGAGNTLFQIMGDGRFCYGADYAQEAINVVRASQMYDEQKCLALVWDITQPPPEEIPAGTLDIVICIFVLSALHPSTWQQAADNIYRLLKPGGLLLVRDYGRFDMAQLRFKANRYLADNFYVRGDGTRVYFFDNQELSGIFHRFKEIQNHMDQRLLVNRLRKLTMQRCWVHAKFQKPLNHKSNDCSD